LIRAPLIRAPLIRAPLIRAPLIRAQRPGFGRASGQFSIGVTG
jgi:hypothetical protein